MGLHGSRKPLIQRLPWQQQLAAAAAGCLTLAWSGCATLGSGGKTIAPDRAEARGRSPSNQATASIPLDQELVPAKRKSPYEALVGRRDDLEVWIVDGMYIRNSIDLEFTNFGHHFRYPFIPRDQLWIDKEDAPDELEFFIAHLVAERRLMMGGATYEDALDSADEGERRSRRLSGDIEKLAGHDGLPDSRKAHIRNNDLSESERPFVLLHELHERNLMAKGRDYDAAHADAGERELRARTHPHASLRQGFSSPPGLGSGRELDVRQRAGATGVAGRRNGDQVPGA